MQSNRHITHAWLWLIGLSIISTVLAEVVSLGTPPIVTGTLVLVVAVLKARTILSRYLGLASAPNWRRGFNLTLTLFALILLTLYLAPHLG
ncbi:nitric oxide reductase F protein [Rhodobacteraceae bacterium D3-12]|nr:nitric oxide reductase F protein [Rhodobacteraceae bacterium D3-12]